MVCGHCCSVTQSCPNLCNPMDCSTLGFPVLYYLLGNGNPLQCSCLENPRGGRAWWAVVYGVSQSRTWLKQLSSSRVCSNSCPLSWWCYLTISSSVAPFSSCPQSLPTSGSFPVSQLFNSSGQSIGASASASILPTNIQDWFPLELTGLISLQFKGLPRVFSNTTIQKHQFFGSQPSLWSNSHTCTWLLEKPQLSLCGSLLAK